jgi:hypothetical protein
MARPRKTGGSRRYFVTVSLEDAERIDSYAAAVDRRPTTVAGDLLLAGLAVAMGDVDDDLAAAKRRIEELEHQLAAVFKAHRPPEPTHANHTRARWEWPIEDLLLDDAWWDRWLPRLYELLGRDLRDSGPEWATGLGHALPVVDSRGYGDLMSYLFPPVEDNGRELTWRSIDYPQAAAVAARQQPHEGVLPSIRPHVWEPALRHVALALCALEHSARAGTDPQLRLDANERITGSWVRTLCNVVGDGHVEELPRPIR